MPPLARPPAHNSSSWPTRELARWAHVWPPPRAGTAGTTQPPLNYLFCTLLAQQREQPCLQASIKISRHPHRLPSHMPSSHQNWQANTSWDTTAHPRPARLPSSAPQQPSPISEPWTVASRLLWGSAPETPNRAFRALKEHLVNQ